MPLTMTYQDWKGDTSRFGRSRSDALKRVDSALKDYWDNGQKPGDLNTLRDAFDAWRNTKTNNGLDSCRNKKDAVQHLADQLDQTRIEGLGGRKLMPVIVRGEGQLRVHRVAPSVSATAKTLTDDDMVTQYTDAVKLLWASWTSKTVQQRGTAMIDAAGTALHACNAFRPTADVKVLPAGYNGFFSFTGWTIELHQSLFDFPKTSLPIPQTLKDVAETVYHESRHCEQWFHMARFYALGRSAVDIQTNLGIGKMAVCNAAVARKMTHDDKMIDLTKEWFTSVYGESNREVTLGALAMKRVSGTPKAVNMNDFHDIIFQDYSGGLPEEIDAWAIQLLVRAKF